MRSGYNLVIPNAIANSVSRAPRSAPRSRVVMRLFAVIVGLAIATSAADWSAPEQQLARKIVAACGPGPVYLTFENRSSLGRRDSEIIQNGIRSALDAVGVHLAPGELGAATVVITLSENPESYVWVAAIRTKAGDNSVVMVSAARPAGAIACARLGAAQSAEDFAMESGRSHSGRRCARRE